MFKAIGKLAQVGTVTALVESLLERLISTGLYAINPTPIAHFVVKATYEQDPNLFNGTHGPKPHKISFAALALTQGLRTFEAHTEEYSACHAALGNLLLAMEREGGQYPLTNKDHVFFELAQKEYLSREFSSDIFGTAGLSVSVPNFDIGKDTQRPVDVPTDEELQRRKEDIDQRLKALRR